MNEIEVIRNQLATERHNASTVANACATALGRPNVVALSSDWALAEFRQACVDYLVRVLTWFEERDRRLTDLSQAGFAPGDAARRALDDALGSREALEKLEAAVACATARSAGGAAQERWLEFAQFFNSVWSARRDALDAWLAANSRATDWRLIAGVDADSMLEERKRYARVAATLPAGASLAFPRPRGA
jgi:hypothetical protein